MVEHLGQCLWSGGWHRVWCLRSCKLPSFTSVTLRGSIFWLNTNASDDMYYRHTDALLMFNLKICTFRNSRWRTRKWAIYFHCYTALIKPISQSTAVPSSYTTIRLPLSNTQDSHVIIVVKLRNWLAIFSKRPQGIRLTYGNVLLINHLLGWVSSVSCIFTIL